MALRVLILFLISFFNISAQQMVELPHSKMILYGVPFLSLSPDAISLGQGDMGVATSPNIFSQHANASKYIFLQDTKGLGISYSPYLNDLAGGMYLAYLSTFKKTTKGVFSGSFTYFNSGSVDFSQFEMEQYLWQGKQIPHEFAVDLAYGLPLSEHFAMAVTGRFFVSALGINSLRERQSVASFSSDIAGLFSSEKIPYNHFYGKYRLGFQISNIGAKIKYTDLGKENFIPTTLKLGGTYDFIFDNEQIISIGIELRKMLIPSPPKYEFLDQNNNLLQDINEPKQILVGKNNQVSFLKGMFQSFYDAPNGLKEELEEISYSLGINYQFNEDFSFQTGYFSENQEKGYRKFISFGTGFSALKTKIHLAYLFSLSKFVNPLEKSLRISIAF